MLLQNFSRRSKIYLLASIIILIGLLFFFARNAHAPIMLGDSDNNAELVLFEDIQISEQIRTILDQRIRVQLAAIEAQEKQYGEVDPDLYDFLALDYSLLGDLENERKIYEILLNLNALNDVVWANYGNVLARMGDLDGAESAYQQALDLRPSQSNHHQLIRFYQRYYGSAYAEQMIEVAQEAFRIYGQEIWIMTSLGDNYAVLGECHKAKEHYKVALQLNPEDEVLQKDYEDLISSCEEK